MEGLFSIPVGMLEEAMLERAIKASIDDAESQSKQTSKNQNHDASESSASASKRRRTESDDQDGDNPRPRRKPALEGTPGVDICGLVGSIAGPSGNRDEKDHDLKGCIIKPSKWITILASAGNVEHCGSHDIFPADVTETFDDVHVSPDIKEALEELSLPILEPNEFNFGILSKSPCSGTLLYGPPGTGKTLLVRALAKQAQATMLALSGADIRSMYVGEGEKKIKRIFAFARRNHPCVIFIDEADSLFRSRSATDNCRSHLSDINQFLAEMDGINSQDVKKPMVIAATNRPFDIDEGILRRLGRRILVGMPDAADREKILEIHLKGETLESDVDLKELARATPEYTGSDLKNLVYEAAIAAIRERRLVMSKGKAPENSGSVQAPRTLRRAHFLWAKHMVPASPKSESVAKIREFHNKFGSTAQSGRRADPRVEKIEKKKPSSENTPAQTTS